MNRSERLLDELSEGLFEWVIIPKYMLKRSLKR